MFDKAPTEWRHHRIPIGTGFPGDVRRDGRPTAVVVAPMPCHPSRRPHRTGDPAPSAMLMEEPAPVVKGGPAPFQVRGPRPAAVGVNPMPFRVGAPSHGH